MFIRVEHPSPPHPGGGQTAFEPIDGPVSVRLAGGAVMRLLFGLMMSEVVSLLGFQGFRKM